MSSYSHWIARLAGWILATSLHASPAWSLPGQEAATSDGSVRPVRSEWIDPKRTPSFDLDGEAVERKQGGNPRTQGGLLVFDGATDGNRQVDPQVAVGGGRVLTATNTGFILYDKEGNYLRGVKQDVFRGGIDPKLFFDPVNRVFGFDLWVYWDDEKRKPVQITMSETEDPHGAWNTYSVPAPGGVDGGAIGCSRAWVGYSFPGGPERTFVMRSAALRKGERAQVWHFPGSLGHPVLGQDEEDALYFLQVTDTHFTVRRVLEQGGAPVAELVGSTPHGLRSIGFPPPSPQKGTDQLTASGDRNPKNVVLQSGFLWFSQTVRHQGRAAVQWHQIRLDGSIVQSGLLASPDSSYIQTSLAVNRQQDVLIGFQETSSEMFISPRCAWRLGTDAPGTMRGIVSLGEGKGATSGRSWGDYSGSSMDGDDGLTLWTVQSITSAEGRGHTVVARVPFEARALGSSAQSDEAVEKQ
ncbi:MAG: hypothetical protein CMJ94_00710 [Planctomycetes bacterium]|nr:hypothetical protein [Planctomycetota bacterium]